MYKALSPGAIGIRVGSILHAITLAQEGDFAGVEFNPGAVVALLEAKSIESVREMFDSAGVAPACFGLPVDFRTTDEKWREGIAALPTQAQAAADIGCTRCATWIMPCSNERPFDENRAFHVERFTPIAQILANNGISLGLEFIGPKTLWTSQKYPFIHTMDAMLEMAADIGPNVGLLLDCWHWHTSGGTLEELRALRPEQVVYVHVNDAPAGVGMDEYVDDARGLPGETGVIDIVGFLQALEAIGYDGPVTAEPFKKELADLPTDSDRLRVVSQAMDKIFAQAGIQER